MRLLFDNNLSPRLVERRVDAFPEAQHVARHGMQRADDEAVWAYATRWPPTKPPGF